MMHPVFNPRADRLRAPAKMICLVILAVVAGGGWTPSAAAVSREWTGAASANWSNPNNWTPAGIPQEGDTLWFYADANKSMLNDIPNLILDTLVFDHRDFVLSGNPLTLGRFNGGGIRMQMIRGSGSATINCALILYTNNCQFLCGPEIDNSARLRINADVNLNGFDLLLDAIAYGSASGGDESARIEMAGSISGNGNVTARANGKIYDTIEFLGTADNTFTGTLFVERHVGGDGQGVYFSKQGGSVVNNRMVIQKAAYPRWRNSNQVGDNATVVIKDGSRMFLNGYNETIGNLVLTNVSSDAQASLVDTFGDTFGPPVGTLSVNDGLVSWVDNASVLPVIKGVLNLPAGNHNFFVFGTGYAGLDMQAVIAGSGGFTKFGTAALLLNGTNTFGGTVFASGGIIDVSNPNGFGSPAGGVVLNGGSVTLRNLTIASETLTAQGQQPINSETTGSLLFSVGTSAWAGAIALETNLVVSGGDMFLTGTISGPGGLDFRTFGTAQLGGAGLNFFTGPTLVRCPLLELNKPFGFRAYSGPLIVGGGVGGPYEVRWLNSYQNLNTPLTLYGNGVVNLNNQVENFGPVTFNGGAIQTGTGFFIAESSLTVNPAASIATVDGNLTLGVSPAYFLVGDGPAEPDLRVNAIIAGANIIKQGPGTLSFTAANTFSGALSVQEGILHADNSAAFGTTGGNTIVYSNATIRLAGVDGLTEAFQLDGTGLGGTNGALQITVGGTTTGNIFLIGPSTINASSGSLAINSVISGTGPLTKTGAGNLYLGGVSGGAGNNTYTGDTIVSAGTLYLSKNQGVMAVPGNLIIGNGAIGPATARFNRSGMMNASATITVNANGLLDLNGNNQTLPRLNLNDGGDVQTGAGTLSFTAGGIVSVGTLNAPQVGLRSGASISGKMALPVLDFLTFEVGAYGAAPFPGEGPELNVSAVIRDAGNIIKTGAGALRLGGANTFNDAPPNFSGDVFVNAGTLIAAHATALGGTAGWTYVNNGGALALLEGITITGENLFLDTTRSPALDSIAGDNIWNGPISLTRDSSVAVSRDWTLQLNGVVSGAGSLTKIGEGELTLGGGANNTHAGNTFVYDGTLVLFKSPFLQAVPHDLIIGSGQPNAPATLVRYRNHDLVWNRITVNANGLLDLNGFNEFSGDLTLNGGGDVQTGAGTYYLANNANLIVNPGTLNNPATISGRLGLFPGQHQFIVNNGVTAPGQFDLNIPATLLQNTTTAGFVKTGNGRMRLAGTNTYTGVTYVGSGALQVDGAQPQSAVELDHDTRLQGAGTVGHILFNGTTAIAPGASAGTLTCSNFDASGGAGNLEIELNGHPTGYDQIVARGLVDLRGLALQASLNFVSSTGQQFTLINNDGADAVTGTFTGLPQNAALSINSESFQISYIGGTGNDVVLTRTPTPPRPRLEIDHLPPSAVRLKWPTNFTGYTLQFSTNLSTTNWSTATPPPVVTGTNRVVTNTTASSPKFYRLKN